MNQTDQNSALPGQPRTARQWLADFGWTFPDPTEQDLADLDMVMDLDEFWEWSSGRVDWNHQPTTAWWQQDRYLWALALAGLAIFMLVGRAMRG